MCRTTRRQAGAGTSTVERGPDMGAEIGGLRTPWCSHDAGQVPDPSAFSLVLRAAAPGSTRPVPYLADFVPVGMGGRVCSQ